MTSPYLALPGAVDGAGPDAGVPAHYGNPMAEQRALAAGTAIVDLSHRAVLSVSGDDRLSWIDSITSQSVKALEPGESSETLLLDPSGRVEYAVRLVDDGTELWMLLERDEAPGLLDFLVKMRFMLRVDPKDRTDEFATIGTLGAPSLPVVAPNGVPLIWHDPWTAVTPGGWQYSLSAEHPGAGWTYSEVLVPRGTIVDLPVAGTLALEALRIEAWRPRFATEADDKTIPHELDWLRSAVHLEKGCYRGQETVAKVHNLGHPPRRLVMLHLDGSDAVLPSRGDEVVVPVNGGDGAAVGLVTSVARHHELGPIALAVIKRSTDPAAELAVRVDGILVPAAQEVVVPPSAGAAADVPRLPRLGAVPRTP
ncbi:MAG: glycine cleavage T C-terminal barrel domain-containing protein [Actinomycetota bacterium]